MKTILTLIFFFSVQLLVAQTFLVQDVNPGSSLIQHGYSGFGGAEYNGWFYYAGDDSLHGSELWKTDGDTCMLVADLFQGTINGSSIIAGSDPLEFTVFNGQLFFIAKDSINGIELWNYDGFSQPSVVSWLPANTIQALNTKLKVYNNKLYVLHDFASANTVDIYSYDGVSVSIVPNPFQKATFLTEFQNKLYFSGDCSSCNGSDALWEFDGSTFTMIPNTITSDLSTTVPSFYSLWGFSISAAVYQNSLYFVGYDSLHGFELWQYDGLTASLAYDCFSGTGNGLKTHNNLKVFNGKLCFSATDGLNGTELWEFDGATASMVQNINSNNTDLLLTFEPAYFTIFNGNLYFTQCSSGASNSTLELYEYDGTTVQPLSNIYPNYSTWQKPSYLVSSGPYMYFRATDNVHGSELWRLESCNVQNTGSQSVVTCNEYTTLSGQTIYSSGILKDTLTNSCGGDSIVTTYLTVNTVNATVTHNGFELQANNTSASYQWVDCENNYATVTGETNQLFTPNNNGNYAVIVTDNANGCIDTSACQNVSGLGLNALAEIGMSIYPNPSQGQFNLHQSGNVGEVKLSAFTLLGQEIPLQQVYNGQTLQLSIAAKGLILLKIESEFGIYIEKLRVE